MSQSRPAESRSWGCSFPGRFPGACVEQCLAGRRRSRLDQPSAEAGDGDRRSQPFAAHELSDTWVNGSCSDFPIGDATVRG